MIKVSVVVPIYNVEKYLDKCLYHLVNQTLQDIEIICVNDGSTDQSQIIIGRYMKNYPDKVKGYTKENGGLSDSRNFGFQYVSGEFVMFSDSDDWIELDCLERMYAKAVGGQYDIVVCGMRNVNEHGTDLGSFALFDTPEITKEQLLVESNSATNLLFKKEILNDIQFPVGIWYEDLATIPRIIAKCDKIGVVRESFYNYLYRSDSITRTYNKKVLDILIAFDYITSCNKYSDTFIRQLFSTHIYFTILRANQIENKEEQFLVLEQLYNYVKQQFGIDSLKSSITYSGLNEKMLMSMFFKHQFKVLMLILTAEWKVKKILVSKK